EAGEFLQAAQPIRLHDLRQHAAPTAITLLEEERQPAAAHAGTHAQLLSIDRYSVRSRIAAKQSEAQDTDVRSLNRVLVLFPPGIHFGAFVMAIQSQDLDPVATRISERVRCEADFVALLGPPLARPGILDIFRLRLLLPLRRKLVFQ